MKKVFDARCWRCDSINAIDIAERLRVDPDEDDYNTNRFLYDFKDLWCHCPKCDKWTAHKVVTGVYECSSDNDNV